MDMSEAIEQFQGLLQRIKPDYTNEFLSWIKQSIEGSVHSIKIDSRVKSGDLISFVIYFRFRFGKRKRFFSRDVLIFRNLLKSTDREFI